MGARRTGANESSAVRKPSEAASLPIWQEMLVGIEMVFLRLSPVYWGFGVPPGDGSAVVVIPGFLLTDLYLTEFRAWINRIGYKAYSSGIGVNAECPNLLIQQKLNATIQKAYKETGRKVHLVGHSLGGVIARAAASQMPDRVASVITLGSPFRGIAVHQSILRAAQLVRGQILERHGSTVLPACYTASCTCNFMESLVVKLPKSVFETAIYTKSDGIADWHCCMTGNPGVDFEVSATHIGLVFNPIVFDVVAHRLAAAPPVGRAPRSPANRAPGLIVIERPNVAA
ncbi:MAG TPA: alpha/beta fold hydrolase [Candidatus Acidoferrales bacterium]|jgi:triacylglycerol lipase|nr:alpha/beta fold hydrolase [Candidatus Acidoferrales bacterium]